MTSDFGTSEQLDGIAESDSRGAPTDLNLSESDGAGDSGRAWLSHSARARAQ